MTTRTLPAAEVALGVGLFLLPFLGMAVAYAVTKMITARYVISTVTGFSMLVAFLAFRASRAKAVTGLAIVSAALLSSMFTWYLEWYAAPQKRNQIRTVFALLDRAPSDAADLPVGLELLEPYTDLDVIGDKARLPEDVLRALGAEVATGRFGADMAVALVNDGPVTLVLERE